MPLFETEKKAMSEADKLRVASEHAAATIELDELKEEKRTNARTYRVRINEVEEKVLSLAKQLDTGAFDVQFEVVEEPDDSRLMMVVKRKDNGREINVRPMTEVEKAAAHKRKQVDMFEGSDTERPPPMNGKHAKKARAKKR